MTWDHLVPIALAIVGTAGVAGLATSFVQLTRPARLRRRAEDLATVRDLLPADSQRRAELDRTLDAVTAELDKTVRNWMPSTRLVYRPPIMQWARVTGALCLVALLGSVVGTFVLTLTRPQLRADSALVFTNTVGIVGLLGIIVYAAKLGRLARRGEGPWSDSDSE